ncbi:MAG TPA: ribokinase [Verrucomicrobiae bacterium]
MPSSRHFDVVVAGGANTDYLIKGPQLPQPGQTIDGTVFLQAPGGKGANQAVAAARLGAKVAFVGCLGNDRNGANLLRGLRAEGIHTSAVKRTDQASSGAALIMVDAQGEKMISCAPGANHHLNPKDISRAEALLRQTRVLLIQFEIPLPSVILAAQIAQSAGALVVLDPAPAKLVSQKLLRLVHLIRPNSTEAAALTGVTVIDLPSARRAAKKLFSLGVHAVATQAGDEGDVIFWPGEEAFFPRMNVKSIDATGAGDAFAAALAVALAEGRSLAQAGALANAAAALATTRLGAQPAMPHRSEVLALLVKSGRRQDAIDLRRNSRKS